MSTLQEKWRGAFEKLVAKGAEPIKRVRGAWVLRIDGKLLAVDVVLAALPAEFERRAQHWEEICDDSGECVEYEFEATVYACDAERVMFRFVDHWQAGLFGTVRVFDDEDAYRAACDEAIADVKEMGEDELEYEDASWGIPSQDRDEE